MKAMVHLFHTHRYFTNQPTEDLQIFMVQEEHLQTVYFTSHLPVGLNLTVCIGLIFHAQPDTTQFVKTQLE